MCGVYAGVVKRKARYPRLCVNHPERVDNLKYIYTRQPNLRDGGLYCKECRDKFLKVKGEGHIIWADES